MIHWRECWTNATLGRFRGLGLAREPGWVLAWDAAQRLYLWDREGKARAEQTLAAPPAVAAISDDGQSSVTLTSDGHLCWFDSKLTLQFDHPLDIKPLAVALEAYGQYLLVSDQERHTFLFSRAGEQLTQVETPRPLQHLVFFTTQSAWAGAANYGFIGCYEADGKCRWRDTPFSNTGNLAWDGGNGLYLASYSEGVRRYSIDGGAASHVATRFAARRVGAAYQGDRLWVAHETIGDTAGGLSLLKSDGTVLGTFALPQRADAVAAGPLGDWGAYGLTEGRVGLVAADRAK
jgi:hypothetical protein